MTLRLPYALSQRALWFSFWLTQALVLLTSSYDFYHVNSYKVALAIACAGLLAPLLGLAAWQRQIALPPLHVLALPLLPVLAAVPGWLLHQGRWNYLAAEQLAQWGVILAWALLAYALVQPVQTRGASGAAEARRYGLEQIAAGLHYLAGASAIVALLDVATKGFALLNVGTGLRATGSYGNPNYLAAFLLLALPIASLRVGLALQQLRTATNRSIVALDVVTLLLIIAALLLTQTRLAQMLTAGFAFAVAAWWVLRFRRRQAPWLLATLCAGFVAAVVVAWQLQLPWLFRFARLLDGRDFAARLVPWQAAIEAWQQSPWFGYGPGSYYALFFQYVDPQSRAYWLERSFIHPHNALLDAAVEGGALGVAGYLVFWGGALWMLWQGWRRHDGVRSLHYLALLAGLGIYLIYSQFDVTYRMITVTLPCLIMLGAAAATLQPRPAQRLPWLLWPALLIAAWVTALPMLQSKYRMMQIETHLKGQPKQDAMIALRDSNPNVYATERLLYLALAQKNWPVFFTTARALERQIPNFRITRHLIATAFAQRGDLRNARKAALDFQQRDRFYAPNNRLLCRIALATDDRELTLRQLAVALDYALKEQRIVDADWRDIDVKIGTRTALTLNPATHSATLILTADNLTNLLKSMTDYYTTQQTPEADRLRFTTTLIIGSLSSSLPPGANFQSLVEKMLGQIM